MFCGLCNGNFIAVFMQLDTAAIEAGPGYNRVLTEPALVSGGASDRLGTPARVETEIRVRVAFESRSTDRHEQRPGGKQRTAQIELTALYEELLYAQPTSLIDPNGRPLIRTGARLDRILNLGDESLVERFVDSPGMYVDEIIMDPALMGGYHQVTWLVTPKKKGL